MHVTTTGSAVANKPLTIEATGSNEQPENALTPIDYGLDLVVFDYGQLPIQCPVSESAAVTTSYDNPEAGQLLTYDQLNEGLSGPFDITLPFTPQGSGTLLVCAYTVYFTDDAAYASTMVNVTPASTPPPTTSTPAPTTTTPPPTTSTTTPTTPPTTTTPSTHTTPSHTAKPKAVKHPRIIRHGRHASCSRGTWSGKPTSYAYRWRIDAAHGRLGPTVGRRASVTLSKALRKDLLVCTVTARNKVGSTSVNTAPLHVG